MALGRFWSSAVRTFKERNICEIRGDSGIYSDRSTTLSCSWEFMPLCETSTVLTTLSM